jgi:ribosomal protein S18 acetylase RimI-like enzyme
MLREFKFPADANVLVDLIPKAFDYPENPAWNFRADERDNMIDSMKMIKRMWPVLSLTAMLVPPLRNAMRGFIWEEGGQPVALVNTGTQNNTGRWFIGNVAVLPEYRRRGLARKLVEAAIKLAQGQRATLISLDVIRGNDPAYKLYETLGFEHYETSVELDFEQPTPPPVVALPNEYTITPLDRFDYRIRYEFVKRITPEHVQRYEPVVEDQFKIPLAVRPIVLMFSQMGGSRSDQAVVRHRQSGQVVALLRYSARTRSGGVNSVSIKLDPQQAQLAPALVSHVMHTVWALSPQRRITAAAESWQPAVVQAYCEAGFTVNHEMLTMALRV